MTACEKCWGDAYAQTRSRGGSQVAAYRRLVADRDDHPCTPEEQSGQFWDAERQADVRDLEETV